MDFGKLALRLFFAVYIIKQRQKRGILYGNAVSASDLYRKASSVFLQKYCFLNGGAAPELDLQHPL